ncbi:hypothetical protein FA15DRAFT_251200 [Coprinopsis marcescibilis]|uniref:F-box domain-containing protein n=1 Tax=Coprinopsis marcescibilis TaxID=230819 RepID=A0A5C3L1N2_COPMA|nr:hypothetical protein FA15DRAFT_251200 [Coprinopsis marcescibilis]
MSFTSGTQFLETNDIVFRISISNPRPIEPEFIPFLSNNNPPPDDLVKAARTRAGLHTLARQHIASQIDVLNQRVAELRQLSTQFADLEDNYLSIASPLRSLPPELMVEVVKRCFNDDGVMDEDDRLTFMHLRYVSRRWRETLLSTHYFWRGLRVRNGWEVANKISSWFDKGGPDAPVILRIDHWAQLGSKHPIYEESSASSQRMKLILNSQRRWKEIKVPDKMDFYATDRFLQGIAVTTLEPWETCVALRLPKFHTRDWPFAREGSRTFANILPNLQELELKMYDTISEGPISHPKVSYLRLNLSDIVVVEGFLSFLTKLPNLQKLRLESFGRPCTNTYQEQVVLPSVRHLQLIGSASAIYYTRYIRLPNLETFKLVAARHNPSTSSLEPLFSLVRESLFLRTIDIREVELSIACVARILVDASNGVEEIRITGPGWFVFGVFMGGATSEFWDEDVPTGLKRIYHPCFDPKDFDILIRFFIRRKTRLDRSGRLEGIPSPVGQMVSILYDDVSKLDAGSYAEQIEQLRCLGVTLSSSSY